MAELVSQLGARDETPSRLLLADDFEAAEAADQGAIDQIRRKPFVP